MKQIFSRQKGRQAGNMAKKLQIKDAVNLAAPHT